MSDEEDESLSEGFSASEDEWKPGKDDRKHDDGESSDDDDSDFEESPIAGVGSARGAQGSSRKRETKSLAKGTGGVSKKKKPMGQSLRAKLFNKYRPPPKTVQTGSFGAGRDSPRASTSQTASKNSRMPNEVSGNGDEGEDDGSSSDSSVGNHLVNPADLDLRSNFFDVEGKADIEKTVPPMFDCNAGIAFLTDSEEESAGEEKPSNAFDFRKLLEKTNSIERVKEQMAKKAKAKPSKSKDAVMDDVTTLLALGENQNLGNKVKSRDLGSDEDDEDDDDDPDDDARAPSKLSKTKSTRLKKHKKTRPASTVIATSGKGDDSDDSDWEEVADDDPDCNDKGETTYDQDGLEIIVEPSSRKRSKEAKTQEELEMAFRRRINRDMKDNQLLLHKTSLLCEFGRSYNYNRLLNDTTLMQEALKILPGEKAYPKESGTELKYFQSLVTWFKTVIKLNSQNLYPQKKEVGETSTEIREQLIMQIKRKEARCKQDMLLIFIALLRGMGLQCRFVVNLQPLPLKPPQHDLLPIKIKTDTKKTEIEKHKTENNKLTNTKKLKANNEKSSKNEKANNVGKGPEKGTKSGSNDMVKPKEERSTRNTKKTTNVEEEGFFMVIDKNKYIDEKKKEKEQKKKEKEEKKKEIEEKKKGRRNNSFHSDSEKDHPYSKRTDENIKDGKGISKPKEDQSKNQEKPDSKRTSSRKRVNSSALKCISTEDKPSDIKPSKRNKISDNIVKDKESGQKPCTSTSKRNLSETDSVIRLDDSTNGSCAFEDNHNIPKISIEKSKQTTATTSATKTDCSNIKNGVRTRSRSRSKSPRPLISTEFLESTTYKDKFSPEPKSTQTNTKKSANGKKKEIKPRICTKFLNPQEEIGRSLRPRQKRTISNATEKDKLNIPQLDGADDETVADFEKSDKKKGQAQQRKLPKNRSKLENSDEDFHPSPPKQPKRAPVLPKPVAQLRKDRRVISTDNDSGGDESKSKSRKDTAADIWVEVWADVENRWICVDLFKGKLDSVESIRKSASSNLAYVFAFQNDLSLKDVTARYCQHWSNVIRKDRLPKPWLDTAFSSYYARRTERDIREDHELRRIHEEKEMPKSIAEFKDHPLYALERHLLKFQAIYPPNAPTFGFTSRGDPIYSRDCVHVLHSREIWLKQARTVKLGEQPYKIVKARPKWDRITQSVIKDLPLEIFGYWQTEDYEPPTAENGIVPRNAYGNVELFKECMLPKKTAHIRLPGLNRICKKLGVDCANAVIGFDFHQGSCHPTYDGFVVCEEFADQVTAAWYEDQEEQERKESEKYEARVYGNWKKLVKRIMIRGYVKKKYNF